MVQTHTRMILSKGGVFDSRRLTGQDTFTTFLSLCPFHLCFCLCPFLGRLDSLQVSAAKPRIPIRPFDLHSLSTLNTSIKIHSRFHCWLAQFGKVQLAKMQNLGLTCIGTKQRCNLGNTMATILLTKRLQQQCSKVSLPLSATFVLRGCAPIL